MNKMNRKIEYSLMALKHMSQKPTGELTTAKEVSETYQAPFDATARVMQVMAQRGWLKSEQGAFGGYFIMKDLSKLSLNDLMEIIEGPTRIVKCLRRDENEIVPCENRKLCNIVSPVVNLNRQLTEFYKGINILELISR